MVCVSSLTIDCACVWSQWKSDLLKWDIFQLAQGLVSMAYQNGYDRLCQAKIPYHYTN